MSSGRSGALFKTTRTSYSALLGPLGRDFIAFLFPARPVSPRRAYNALFWSLVRAPFATQIKTRPLGTGQQQMSVSDHWPVTSGAESYLVNANGD